MSAKLQCFYYNWYSNVAHDGLERHWNHRIMSHHSDRTWDKLPHYPGGDDIGANFYPQLGCYSSADEATIHQHFSWMQQAGIGVCIITWLGDNSFEDSTFHKYLEICSQYNIQIALHIEPSYQSIAAFLARIQEITLKFGDHPALLRHDGKLVYYIYDSYKLPASDWALLFDANSPQTIRNTRYDGVFIGLWVEADEEEFFVSGCFDGVYTYFASAEFVYGSTPEHWSYMSQWAHEHQKLFIPCVGPGYIDTRIRPWNVVNNKNRNRGAYYDYMFAAAIDARADFIAITSFNEWHEGTQIEPAISKDIATYTYEDYLPDDPEFYLRRTAEWSKKLDLTPSA